MYDIAVRKLSLRILDIQEKRRSGSEAVTFVTDHL